MQRDISNTEKQKIFFEMLGDASNVTATTLKRLFGNFLKTGIAFYTDDIITIGTEQSKFVKNNTATTVGIYIMNKYIIEELEIFGYINKTFDGKYLEKIGDVIGDARLAGDLTQEQVFRYIDKTQWLFGGQLAHVINNSLSEAILTLPPKATKLRLDLIKKHKDDIDNGNAIPVAKIGDDVTDMALKEMREKYSDDPALALFDSKCGIDPYNNYKTMFVMKGPIVDNTGLSPTGYKCISSDYNTGITKEDMPKFSDGLVTGAYARGVATMGAGYETKKMNAINQRTRLGPRGSDCGTKDYEEYLVTEKNVGKFGKYHFIMEDGKPVMVTPKTAKKYIGKTVKLRTPSCCKMKDPCYCNICYGDMSYRLGVTNVGLSYNIAGGAMLNASMKTVRNVVYKLSA